MTENSLTSKLRLWFSLIASRSAEAMGSALAFAIATLSVVAWAVSGPFFHYSDTWQLVINTGTTVLTFLLSSSFSTARTAMAGRSSLSWMNLSAVIDLRETTL